MFKLDAILNTDGSGYWSTVSKNVTITGFTVPYISDDRGFGELKVYFDTASWDIDRDGLIYTDRQFLAELVALLNRNKFAGDDISYSEQGMQGDNFVSLDVGEQFINSYFASLPTPVELA